MKKTLSLFLALALVLALAACGTGDPAPTTTAGGATPEPSAPATPEATPEATEEPATLLSMQAVWGDVSAAELQRGTMAYDDGSVVQVYGAADYFIDGGDIYVLNSASNSITKFTSGSVSRVIELDAHKINGMRIAVSGGDVYVLGVDHETNGTDLVCIDKDNKKTDVEFFDQLGGSDVTAMTARDGRLYISTTDNINGTTYIFSLEAEEGGEEDTANYETVDGCILADGTVYRTDLTPSQGYTFGQTASLIVTAPDGEETTLTFTSDYMISDAELLRRDGDSFYVRLEEVSVDAPASFVTAECVLRMNAAGEISAVFPVPEQIVNTGNVIKCFDGELYMMNTAEDSVEIMRITDGDYIAPEDYVSPLGAIMEE